MSDEDEPSETDPFEELGADGDRDGDPFESLAEGPEPGSADDDSEPAVATDADDIQLDDNPFSDPEGGKRKRRADPGDDPLADVDVAPGGDPFASGDWSTGGEDDSVWEKLSEPVETETTQEAGGRRLSAVNKHSFCEQCEYFTGPPEIACTHEGTDILAFLDMETVRVADCPIVEERERLEESGTQ
jgi:hypothetical protein